MKQRMLIALALISAALLLSGYTPPGEQRFWQRGTVNGTSLSVRGVPTAPTDTINTPTISCLGLNLIIWMVRGDSTAASTCSLSVIQVSHDGVTWFNTSTSTVGGVAVGDSCKSKNINAEPGYAEFQGRNIISAGSAAIPYEYCRLQLLMNQLSMNTLASLYLRTLLYP